MPWEWRWDGSKGTKMWTLFQSKEIIKKLQEGVLDTHHMHHLNIKGKKASVSYSIRDIYTLANGQVL